MPCRRNRNLQRLLAGACLVALSATAAAEPFGAYIGAALGQSNVRSDEVVLTGPLRFDEHHSAWKVMAGIRPITLLGAEIEYIDFGHPRATSGAATADVQDKATALFGVIGLPIPLPLIDIFGKAGVAHLQSTINAQVLASQFHRDRSDTNFAYGAGVQLKFSALAVRAEYERINASGGDPDLLSVGVTWTF